VPVSVHTRRERFRVAVFASGIILAFSVGDFMRPYGNPWIALAARAVFVALMLGHAWYVHHVEQPNGALLYVTPLGMAAAYTAVCWAMGGVQTPYFAFFMVFPLAAGALLPDKPQSVVSITVGLMAGAAWLMLVESASLRTVVAMEIRIACCGGVAVYGCLLYSRLLRAEVAVEKERASALERLAESEQRRGHVERLAVVGRVAAGVAHEINNPLTAVKANLQWALSKHVADSPELRAVFEESIEGCTRIETIVSDLRVFAREDPGAYETCAPERFIEEAARLANVRFSGWARLEVDLGTALPRVRVHRVKIVQALLNLLVNAADALESLPRASDKRARIVARLSQEALEITVEDNGPGMTDETQRRLFEPFFTTKAPGKGTGLGLALSREFIQGSGGELRAGNAASGGACFTIRLPPADVEVAPGPIQHPST
jgi:two-component system, NtrC family, sensor kinase